MTIDFKHTLSDGRVVTVIGTYYPVTRGMRDSLGGKASAGPPLEPDEPAWFEIESVNREDGYDVQVTLTDEEVEVIKQRGINLVEVPTSHACHGPEPEEQPWDDPPW